MSRGHLADQDSNDRHLMVPDCYSYGFLTLFRWHMWRHTPTKNPRPTIVHQLKQQLCPEFCVHDVPHTSKHIRQNSSVRFFTCLILKHASPTLHTKHIVIRRNKMHDFACGLQLDEAWEETCWGPNSQSGTNRTLVCYANLRDPLVQA